MNAITRRAFLRRAAILFIFASALALIGGCGTFTVPAPTPTPARIYRIGWLTQAESPMPWHDAFWQELRNLGYVEGKNIAVEKRYAAGNNDLLPAMASELVALKVDIIVTSSLLPSLAAKNATSTIPIVSIASADPVGSGLVASLAHPGGNVTGMATAVAGQVNGKKMELLKEAVPGVSRLTILWDASTNSNLRRELQETGDHLGFQIQWLEIQKPDDLEGAFASAIRNHTEAVFQTGSINILIPARIVDFAAKNRLPAMYGFPDYARAGGLMSYGVNLNELYARGATYVDKILRGAKPADLPVEQPTKFEFVINLKTAKQLGITIPPSVLAQATEVIQ